MSMHIWDEYKDLETDMPFEVFREAVEDMTKETEGIADEKTAATLIAYGVKSNPDEHIPRHILSDLYDETPTETTFKSFRQSIKDRYDNSGGLSFKKAVEETISEEIKRKESPDTIKSAKDQYEALNTELSLKSFREAVEDMIEQMGGLADEETAAKLVAHELKSRGQVKADSQSSVPDLSEVASPPPQSITYDDLQVSEEPLGAGGQAVVYEATISGCDTSSKVALKEPKHSGTITPEVTDSFLQEAKTWQTIDQREREKPRWNDYEHIVGVIDTGKAHLPWIAIEYMDGGDLADRLENASDGLPVDEALWIGECICRGLEIADEYGYSHLDIKPKNILFRKTPKGKWDVPKIADWGIARVLSEETGTMNQKSVRYSAPEQFDTDDYGDPDSLTDLYQVGAVVYTMLTGEPPHTGSNTQVMKEIVLGDRPDPPSHHRSELTETVDIAVKKAMEQSKSDRYRGLQNFEQALRAIRTGGTLPTSITQQTDQPSVTHQSEPNKKESHQDEANSVTTADSSVEFTGTVVKAENPIILDNGTETRQVETNTNLRLGEEVTVRGTEVDGTIDADELF